MKGSIVAGLILSSFGIPLVPSATWVIEVPEHIPSYSLVEAEVTAYTADPAETDERPWETASGGEVREGIVACPSRLAFGTKVEIAGRILLCEDRMHRRFRDGEYYDMFFVSRSEAKKWGRQTLKIKVYE